MKVAAALGFGPEPEALAWEALTHWAASEGLRLNEHRLFGFNNPSPTPGSPNYGYEQWLVLKERAIGSAEVQINRLGRGADQGRGRWALRGHALPWDPEPRDLAGSGALARGEPLSRRGPSVARGAGHA